METSTLEKVQIVENEIQNMKLSLKSRGVKSDSGISSLFQNFLDLEQNSKDSHTRFTVKTTADNQKIGFHQIANTGKQYYTTISWGDGEICCYNSNLSIEHEYKLSGEYKACLYGGQTQFDMRERDKGKYTVGLNNIISIHFSDYDTTIGNNTFGDCSKLSSLYMDIIYQPYQTIQSEVAELLMSIVKIFVLQAKVHFQIVKI